MNVNAMKAIILVALVVGTLTIGLWLCRLEDDSVASGRDMIGERTPGEKLAYADGFKQAVKWFESAGVEIDQLIHEAWNLHTLMLGSLDPPKQAAPNDHWCIGCSPDPDNVTDQPCCGCERPRPTDGP